MKYEKIVIYILSVCLIVSICGACVLKSRLDKYMDRCEQYRVQLTAARNREREIGECISRTSVILSETSNTVAGLREKLEAVENNYNYMLQLFDDSGDSRGACIEGTVKGE